MSHYKARLAAVIEQEIILLLRETHLANLACSQNLFKLLLLIEELNYPF